MRPALRLSNGRAWAAALLAAAACGVPSGSDGGSGGGSGGAGGGGGAGGAGGGSATFEQEWVAAHNAQRAAVMPAPSTALPEVTWSATVAATAQAWADRCNFQHNAASGYGENLFASAGGGAPDTPTEVVADWVSEKADYTYSTNTCAAGKACGHYTQVVWRSSVRIGCAQKTCTTGSPFGSGTWSFILCNYDPPGNFVGQKPY